MDVDLDLQQQKLGSSFVLFTQIRQLNSFVMRKTILTLFILGGHLRIVLGGGGQFDLKICLVFLLLESKEKLMLCLFCDLCNV